MNSTLSKKPNTKKFKFKKVKKHLDPRIGTHIPKNKTFYNSLTKFYEEKPSNKLKPTQLFTGSPKFWRRPKMNEIDINKTRKYVDDNKLSVFIHSIYLINLSKSPLEFKERALECLQYELEIGTKLGFKGVVVHCGKSLKLNNTLALQNMYDNIISIYESGCISNSNPLLIETSPVEKPFVPAGTVMSSPIVSRIVLITP